jgi:hypothetical protein
MGVLRDLPENRLGIRLQLKSKKHRRSAAEKWAKPLQTVGA